MVLAVHSETSCWLCERLLCVLCRPRVFSMHCGKLFLFGSFCDRPLILWIDFSLYFLQPPMLSAVFFHLLYIQYVRVPAVTCCKT